jgi:thiol-disulfide isomerase/thioredoxin
MGKITLFATLLICTSAAAQTVDFKKDGIGIRSYTWQDFQPMLNTQTDTIYVVNFWATWCAPCIKELPHFERLESQYAGKKVKVLLVSLDMRKQIESALIPFIKRKDLKPQVVHLYEPNADAWINKVDATWSGALPATVIFDRDGRKFYERSFTYEALERELQTFIP